MGRGGHGDGDEGTPFDQRLEEIEFLRSAASAAQRGDAARLSELLQRTPEAVHSDGVCGTTGYTPLHYAAREGHAPCVALLLARGARPDARTKGGATPLHRAAFAGRAEVVRLLLEAGADASALDDGARGRHCRTEGRRKAPQPRSGALCVQPALTRGAARRRRNGPAQGLPPGRGGWRGARRGCRAAAARLAGRGPGAGRARPAAGRRSVRRTHGDFDWIAPTHPVLVWCSLTGGPLARLLMNCLPTGWERW